MIKVTVLYPNSAGATFDYVYYRDRHMPMVKGKVGAALKRYTFEKGLGGGAPGSPPAYIATASVYVDSIETFQAAMAEHGNEIMADVPKFTNIQPQFEIAEVVVD